MNKKKFKVKFKERWEYQGRHFATCIGMLNGDILELSEDVWGVIQVNPKSSLASYWRSLVNCVEKITKIN